MSLPESYGDRLSGVGGATLTALAALEAAQRRLHPPGIDALRASLTPVHARLCDERALWDETSPPEGLEPFHTQLAEAASHAEGALARFCEPAPAAVATATLLEGMRLHCRAQESLYPLHVALPPVSDYFLEPALRGSDKPLDPEPPSGVPVGLYRGGGDDENERGGFSLYVPEWYDGRSPWPLVVALHGGYGAGRDFLFSWLREARSRGFLLLAPTSRGTTWSLDAPGLDQAPLFSMVRHVEENWSLDRDHVLLTGLSDGATFALLAGLAEGSPFTHLAPVSGVLHPANFALGNLERARGKPIHLVHGALDWLFPVALARSARDALEEAGAALVYREIEDLSHTYPREENAHILSWLDPGLALSADGA